MPYSAMNPDAWGLLCEDALPMMVWAQWCRFCGFDFVLHENVPNFPVDVLGAVLEDPEAMGTVYGPAAVVVNSPSDFGSPKRRRRQWSRWKSTSPRQPATAPLASQSEQDFVFSAQVMTALFGRDVVCSPQVFLTATEEDVQTYYRERAAARGLLLCGQEASGKMSVQEDDVIPPCARVHLLSHNNLHREALRRGDVYEPDFVCLMQSPYHGTPAQDGLAPPLLTGTLLHSLVAGRLVLPSELAMLSGIPQPQPTGNELAPEVLQLNPWDGVDMIGATGESSFRKMLGNGMDMAQITAALATLLLEARGV